MILQRMAQWTGKLLGGLVGFFSGGPIGAAVGVLVGHQIDRSSEAGPGPGPALDSAAIGDCFFRTTFQVMGHVAKADGRVSEQEIAAARAVMSELRLDASQVRAAIAEFTIGKQASFDLYAALDALARVCGGRPDITRVFVEIQMRAALGGSDLAPAARELMRRIAARLGLSGLELAHIEAVLRMRAGAAAGGRGRAAAPQRLEQAYAVLEVTAAASDDEVAKAYRRQLSRHHPDKLKANGLPESMIEHAKQRTQQIIEAYELIRERRGI
jgi:DnaJ like chaperone protein